MIDTHSHINFEEYKNNFEDFLLRINKADVEKVIIPGVDNKTFQEISDLANQYDMLYFATGTHPSEAKTYKKEDMLPFLKNKKNVAIGEIGLDYYWETETKELQKEIFNSQLEIAQEYQLPVIIHDREAHQDSYEILKDYKLKDVVYHCFSGTKEFAKKCLDKGYYIAIGGIVTFKNAKDLKETAQFAPLDRILLETDAPYLAPVPFRGKLNSPEYLIYIAQEIANLRNIDVEEVKNQTTLNAKRVFNF